MLLQEVVSAVLDMAEVLNERKANSSLDERTIQLIGPPGVGKGELLENATSFLRGVYPNLRIINITLPGGTEVNKLNKEYPAQTILIAMQTRELDAPKSRVFYLQPYTEEDIQKMILEFDFSNSNIVSAKFIFGATKGHPESVHRILDVCKERTDITTYEIFKSFWKSVLEEMLTSEKYFYVDFFTKFDRKNILDIIKLFSSSTLNDSHLRDLIFNKHDRSDFLIKLRRRGILRAETNQITNKITYIVDPSIRYLAEQLKSLN